MDCEETFDKLKISFYDEKNNSVLTIDLTSSLSTYFIAPGYRDYDHFT